MNAPHSAADDPLRIFRDELRARHLAAREAIEPTEHAVKSRHIERFLEALIERLAIGTLAFCWPFRAEFDARPLAARAIQRGLRVCLPVVAGKDRPLAFREWTPQSRMVEDRYGIHIPDSGEALVPEAILMPVVAFDSAGYRLGYGGGYFDRTLAALRPRPLAIGVGFESARVATIRPQEYDQPMNWLVTETGAQQKTWRSSV